MAAVGEHDRPQVAAAVVLPGEVKQHDFGDDEHDARQPENEVEQPVDRAAVLRDVARQPNVVPGREREGGNAHDRHEQEQQGPQARHPVDKPFDHGVLGLSRAGDVELGAGLVA
jgi:hypothetical protein